MQGALTGRTNRQAPPPARQLGQMPGMGVARPEVRPNLRSFPAGNYLILYQQVGQDSEIVRVIHGARQWQDLL